VFKCISAGLHITINIREFEFLKIYPLIKIIKLHMGVILLKGPMPAKKFYLNWISEEI
jgi:hypothetical protein